MKIRVLQLSAVSASALLPVAARAEQAGSAGNGAIMVTASALNQRVDETAAPVIALTGDELVHRRQATLGDTLAGVRATNRTNDLGFNHASFIKDAAPLRGRNFVAGVRTVF